jgi:DNA invertase Pin-like site-specific DNA recombinase
MDGKFVSYLRVSTDRQGKSGLGLEAQREAVAQFLNGGAWSLLGEYIEVESGKHDNREQLAKAFDHAKMTGSTLVVAKLDRLSRNQAFLMQVYEEWGEGGVVFCDLPSIPAGPVGKFLVQQMAAVAELERGLISQRTKVALKAAKARGVKLGGFRGSVPDTGLASKARKQAADSFAARIGAHILKKQAEGASLRQIADHLSKDGILTARGGKWTATAVKNVLERLA